MKLEVVRKWKRDTYTIGALYVNGVRFCDTLEDKDRGLKQTQNAFTETIEEIAAENEGKSLFRHPALVIKKGEEE